jgi:pimeloyl-ACP methyl ester carboxylesterase
LIKPANWLSHLEFEWQSPVWGHWWRELSRHNLLVRFDQRGVGLSDWDVSDLSFETFVSDLEAVIEATGFRRFALLGVSQGCATCIAYAVRHPERVAAMVLYGGYAAGWRARGDEQEIARRRAMVELMRTGWGLENAAFRQLFASLFVPNASPEQMQWFNDLARITTSPENAVRLSQTFGQIDVRHLLRQVRVPTLVLHQSGDAVVPMWAGRLLATEIPNAKFVALDGSSHIILEDEASWRRFLSEVREFLDELIPSGSGV